MLAWIGAGNDPKEFRTEQGWTLLHLAAEYRDISAIRSLAKFGLDPNVPDKSGWTALHLAVDADSDASAQSGLPLDFKTVGVLVAVGANPRVKDLEGQSPRDIANLYGTDALAAYDSIV